MENRCLTWGVLGVSDSRDINSLKEMFLITKVKVILVFAWAGGKEDLMSNLFGETLELFQVAIHLYCKTQWRFQETVIEEHLLTFSHMSPWALVPVVLGTLGVRSLAWVWVIELVSCEALISLSQTSPSKWGCVAPLPGAPIRFCSAACWVRGEWRWERGEGPSFLFVAVAVGPQQWPFSTAVEGGESPAFPHGPRSGLILPPQGYQHQLACSPLLKDCVPDPGGPFTRLQAWAEQHFSQVQPHHL